MKEIAARAWVGNKISKTQPLSVSMENHFSNVSKQKTTQ